MPVLTALKHRYTSVLMSVHIAATELNLTEPVSSQHQFNAAACGDMIRPLEDLRRRRRMRECERRCWLALLRRRVALRRPAGPPCRRRGQSVPASLAQHVRHIRDQCRCHRRPRCICASSTIQPIYWVRLKRQWRMTQNTGMESAGLDNDGRAGISAGLDNDGCYFSFHHLQSILCICTVPFAIVFLQ